MKTKYWINREQGEYDYWLTDAETLTRQIEGIVDYYEEIGIKLTNRQLYYQLVGKDFIPNYMEIYKRICTFLTDLRYAGIIDWDSIEDKARVARQHVDFNGIPDLIDTAIYSYRLPRWQDQNYYVEMYCEKEAGINVLQPIADKYHIHFGFNKGYSSAAALYVLSRRLIKQIDSGKDCVILYFGDHDPSGLDMIRDINERVSEFSYGSSFLEVVHCSLTTNQVEHYSPPPNPAKITDPRAKGYIKTYGNISWELDAIDALELRRIAEENILNYLDIDLYDAWINQEKEDKKLLVDFGKTLK